MIKTILTLTLLISGMIIWAQTETQLISTYKISNGDTTSRYIYDYDELYQLKTVIWINNEGDSANRWHYENDTIRYFTNIYGAYKPYTYTDDSIIQYNADESQALAIYYLNDQHHVDHMYYYLVTPEDYYQEWTGSNITEQTWELWGTTYRYVYTYSDYLNPAYTANKIIQNDTDGSYNMVERTSDGSGNEVYQYDVVESLNNYPLRVNVSKAGNLEHQLCFEYRIISETPEFRVEPGKTLSINYYDMMGREMEKPTKGFYIERKTTDKGTFCKKYFLQ